MGDELDSTAIAYRLLLGWDTAWEKYRGVTRGVGALPGIALLEVAEVVPDEERKLRRYWLSKVRAEINLALRQCQAEGWLARQDVNPSLLRDFGPCFGAVYGAYSDEQIGRWAREHDGPDVWWWIRTITGESEAVKLVSLLTEDRRAPLGFRPLGSDADLS